MINWNFIAGEEYIIQEMTDTAGLALTLWNKVVRMADPSASSQPGWL
jgi:hypothetical protein